MQCWHRNWSFYADESNWWKHARTLCHKLKQTIAFCESCDDPKDISFCWKQQTRTTLCQTRKQKWFAYDFALNLNVCQVHRPACDWTKSNVSFQKHMPVWTVCYDLSLANYATPLLPTQLPTSGTKMVSQNLLKLHQNAIGPRSEPKPNALLKDLDNLIPATALRPLQEEEIESGAILYTPKKK